MVAMGPKLIYLATKRNSVSHFKEQEWHCCIHCLYGETSHTESFQNVSNIAKSAWNSWGMLWLCYCYIANTSWFEQEWVSWELRNLYCWCACPTLCWKNLLEKGVTLLPKHRQEASNFLFLLLHASTRWWWRKLYAITAYSKGLALGFVLPAISQSLSLGADPFQSCSLLPVLFIFMHQIWCRVWISWDADSFLGTNCCPKWRTFNILGFVHKREETGKGDWQTYWWGLGSEVDAMPICCGEKRAESESKSTAMFTSSG